MKPYSEERCTNPGAFYSSADEVLADSGLTAAEKEYILKSMAVDAELLDGKKSEDAPPGEYPAEVTEIYKALNQIGGAHSLDGKDASPSSRAEREPRLFSRIVAAVSGHDDLDREVVTVTRSVVQLSGGEVTFVSVVPPDPGPAYLGAAAPIGGGVVARPLAQVDLKTRLDERRALVRDILSGAVDAPSPYHLDIRHGRIDDELLHAAEECSADLIVVGSQDRSWFQGLFSSETAHHVASLATCPVLIVPETVKG